MATLMGMGAPGRGGKGANSSSGGPGRAVARRLQPRRMASPPPVGAAPHRLDARRILVVEDEYLVARYLTRGLVERGAVVVGPVARVDAALALIEQCRGEAALHGAILDVTLNEQSALPIADRLREECVPFVFATGYDRASLPSRFNDVTLCVKPVQVHELIKALGDAIGAAP